MTMKHFSTYVALLLTSLCMAMPALAQDRTQQDEYEAREQDQQMRDSRQQQDRQMRDSRQQQDRQMGGDQQQTRRGRDQQQAAERIVFGRVTDTMQVQLEGVAGNGHRLVKIENEKGKSMVIDLGREDTLPGLELAPGDRIIAAGKPARIDDRPVLYAKYVGKLYATGQSGETQQQQQARQQRQRDQQQQARRQGG
jgi:hypothetical protein